MPYLLFNMFQYLRLIIFILLATYLILCSIVFFYQRALIYHPTPLAPESAQGINLSVDTAVLKISVREWEGNKAVIYFGGNAETVSQSMPNYAKAFPDYAVYMPHYRGYSGSTGQPTEEALHKDAEKLYDLVREKHPEITLIGRSLGSGLAVRLAAKHKVDKLILITPFDSMLNLARLRFPNLPVGLMLKDKFESWRYAPEIKAPTLILAAEHDQTIPLANSKALFERFKTGIAEFKVVNNTDHINISKDPNFYPLLTNAEDN